MNLVLADPILSAILSLVVKASVLLGLAAVVQLLLHARSSAAARHFAWSMTVAALLVLPPLTAALPSWVVATRPAEEGVGRIHQNFDQNLPRTQEVIAIPGIRPDPAPAAPPPAGREAVGGYAVAAYVVGLLAMLVVAAA